MSVENAKKFVNDVKTNDELAKKVKTAEETGNPEEVIVVAKASGYDFTLKELEEALIDCEELAVDELDAVAGGGSYCIFTGNDPKAFCIFTGSSR